MIISLDMYQTLFAAVCVLMLAACCLPFSPVSAM